LIIEYPIKKLNNLSSRAFLELNHTKKIINPHTAVVGLLD